MSTHPLTARIAADELAGALKGHDRDIISLAPLAEAAAGQLTFAVDPQKYADSLGLALGRGAVVLVPRTHSGEPGEGTMIGVDNPRGAFAQLAARHFARRPEPGVAGTARIARTAQVDPSAHVGEYTVIRDGAVIGAHAEIRDHVVIGHDVVVGDHALIKSHAVIGEEGFGMEKDEAGNNIRIPHLGAVVLGRHVEVGGFTTVCSGTLSPTRVGDHTKIDDHVHIAHNCQIGRNVIITACAEVSGSVIIDDDVWIGPNAAILQGVRLGNDSLVGIGAVVLKSVPVNEVRVGNPARRIGDNKK